ncbi:SagB family peptide dehydrogenase [Sulfurovum sp. XGS-02]|uniref:SagB family peptide dehydrogenase n=1 Tax=Sulfurovum sp. XGS-02 TaxID=2925411 RepID=UPI00205DE94C|nr:SagB family peptide dehydrogenase [Sulfurovum sp. XGS-02]UPT77659.1 SagB family peptide dehydrogenase [Sulfurovum sp. XGS-02]
MFWYHSTTKHSYNSVRTNPNRLSWEDQPSTYKNYPTQYEKRKLDLEKEEDHFLYHIAGLTAKKSYPSGEYYLRINPSAGALYPNELYFQARGVEGIEDGVYHYEVSSSSLTLLQRIPDHEGLEPYFGYKTAMEGYLFLVSAVYFRSSWKYKNRAFRYCLLDAGHLLGSIEAAVLLKSHTVEMVYTIDREKLNRMFGFEGREWFLSGCARAVPIEEQEVAPIEFALSYVDGSRTFEPNPLIEQAYHETMQLESCRREEKAPTFTYNKTKLQETIFTRRSQRGFQEGAITKGQFNYIMDAIHQPVPSDCDEEVSVYVVINRVLDMPLGLYKEGAYIKYGDFARKAGYLSLEQYSLSMQGAVAFFLTSKGNNYQALYQKAGIIGHRLYVASLYMDIGCSGIGAYYDDEVNEFVENDEMVLYALAIGK